MPTKAELEARVAELEALLAEATESVNAERAAAKSLAEQVNIVRNERDQHEHREKVTRQVLDTAITLLAADALRAMRPELSASYTRLQRLPPIGPLHGGGGGGESAG